jgi:hypothetical protein
MSRWGLFFAAVSIPCVFIAACGSQAGSAGGGGPKDGGVGGSSGGGTADAGVNPTNVGQIEGGLGETGLPNLPTLTNVVATEREDSVGIDFDPVDDAVDYRVYPLPNPGDVTVNADGSLTIKNAIYRCAGLRQTYDLPNNTTNDLNNPDAGQVYENFNPQYSWTAEIPASPTVGYVYVTPGTGLVPVYAIGVHPTAPEVGWRETRPKIYTTDSNLRASLLANSGRDDGIVFYVPSAASAATTTVYHSENVDSPGQNLTSYTESYFTSADMSSHMMDTTPPAPAFQVLTAGADGTKPLMAVTYHPGQDHTELAVGKERFKRASNQGPGPLWHLEWAGITAPTTLVVEALSSGCPFQGFLSPQTITAPPHQPLLTMAQLASASPTGEVYINGQFDLPGTTYTILTGNGSMGGMWSVSDAGFPMLQTKTSSPVPTARSFIQVSPKPHNPADWDWYQGFNVGSDFGTVTTGQDPKDCACQMPGATVACQNGNGGCGYWTSPNFDIGAYLLDIPNNQPLFAYGQLLGQLWDVLDDTYQDVTAMTRFTANKSATISSDPNQYLKVTWTVNTVGTPRRYPQLIISDQPSPVQDSFENPDGNTVLIQTRIGPSMRLELEAFHGLVNGKPWAVNNQATVHGLVDYDNWSTPGTDNSAPTGKPQPIPGADSPFEHAGMDRMTRYDAFISASQLYVFMDGAPAACAKLPASPFVLNGTVTVTFGDVLYHESAGDELVCAGVRPYSYMHEHECSETKRHWDDLGFKSGVPAPAWDSVNYPCTPF